MLKNSDTNFGWIHIIVHWVSAVAVIGLFAVGYWMVDLNYYSEWYRTAPDLHKSFGLTLFALTLFRLGWLVASPTPSSLSTKPIEKHAAKAGHITLYLLLIAIMVSGYMISTADGRGIEWFGLFEVPGFGEIVENQEDIAGKIHEWLAYGLIGVAIVHALAALKHHFVDKDKTLVRMLKANPKD